MLIVYIICAIIFGLILVYLFSDEACDKWEENLLKKIGGMKK